MTPAAIIPVIGREGDNLAMRSATMSWYTGPTVLEALDAFRSQGEAVDGPFRMPVQAVFKFTNDGDDRRIVAGTIDSGRAARRRRGGVPSVGQADARRSRSRRSTASRRPWSGAGESAGFTLAQQIYVTRGELATLAHEPQPVTATRIRASIFWLGARPLELGTELHAQARHRARVGASRAHRARARCVDAGVGDRSHVGRAQRGRRLRAQAAASDRVRPGVGARGDQPLRARRQLQHQRRRRRARRAAARRQRARRATRAPRAIALRPGVLWLTGERGAGKTRARALARRPRGPRRARGSRSSTTTPSGALFPAGGSRAEQDLRVRRLAWLASRLEAHGAAVDRRRRLAGGGRAPVRATARVRLRRDPPARRARRAGVARRSSATASTFEAPVQPELRLDTGRLSLDEAGAEVIAWLRGMEQLSHEHDRRRPVARPARAASITSTSSSTAASTSCARRTRAFRSSRMLWSIGKDSTVLLWLARKAFFGHVPMPLVHIDTSFKIPEMIQYRDRLAAEWQLTLIYGQNEEALAAKQTFPDGNVDRLTCCGNLKTEALQPHALRRGQRYRFDHAHGQVRRRHEHGAVHRRDRRRARRRRRQPLEGALLLAALRREQLEHRRPAAGVLEPVQDGVRAGHARAHPSAARLDGAQHLGVHRARAHPDRAASTTTRARASAIARSAAGRARSRSRRTRRTCRRSSSS